MSLSDKSGKNDCRNSRANSVGIGDGPGRQLDDRAAIPSSDYQAPDGGYGWVCVGACFAINGFTWGVIASYGVYLSFYLSIDTFPGARPLDYALIGGLNYAVAMAASPFVTAIIKRYRSRPPMLAGAVMFSGGFISASFASRVWHLYLTQGVLVGLGVGFIYLPSIAIIPQWFEKRRSLASAVSAAGSGIGGLIFSLATGSMIRTTSLAWSLRIVGIITAIVNLVAVILIRDRDDIVRPNHAGLKVKLLLRADVRWLLMWAFIMLFGYIGLQFSLSDFARSIGISEANANLITALLNVGTACGRPFVGFLCDRYGRIEVAGLMTLATGVLSVAVWLPAKSLGLVAFFALIEGAIYGIFWAGIGPLCAEVVGLKEMPALLSLAWMTVLIPTLVGEVIALALRRPERDGLEYLYPQIFVGLSYIVASFCLWRLRSLVRYRRSVI